MAEKELEKVRKLAFFGATLASIGTLLGVVMVPLVYDHIQQVHTIMLNELDFCQARAANVFSEIRVTKVSFFSKCF